MDITAKNLDGALIRWRDVHDEMQDETALLRQEVAEAQARLTEAEKPYRDELAIIGDGIKDVVATHIKGTWKGDGAEARYRKGARRVTYRWQTVDSVLGVLRDVLPETAVTLEGARKESLGKPSVSIVRV